MSQEAAWGDATASLPEDVAGQGGSASSVPSGPTKQSCIIYQLRRGPGPNSRWQTFSGVPPAGPDYPYYNGWDVWIPGVNPKSSFTMGYAPVDWRYEDGWIRTTGASPQFSGNYDPCNRCSGTSCQTCQSQLKEMPVQVEYPKGSGFIYKLMNKLYSQGGRCGSPECPCYVSGIMSPLVIDFGKNGLRYTQDGEHVAFDFGDGAAVPTSWIANGTEVAFLGLDLNGNGLIDDGNELFGNIGKGPDKKAAADGFAALAKYDSNGDHRIDSQDKIFSSLLLWLDENGDGKSQPGELTTLSKLHVRSLSLDSREVVENQDPYGNSTRGTSSVELDSGETRALYDVWLAPVHPLSLRTNPGGHIAPTAMPARGAPNYDTLHASWKSTLDAENFSEGEMPFENGQLSARVNDKGEIVERVASWSHRHGGCRLVVVFDEGWHQQKATSECH